MATKRRRITSKRYVYHIPRLTRTEYATLEWLSDRGYDGNILNIAGVEEEYPDGSIQLGDLTEPQAWRFSQYIEEDPDAFLVSSGSKGLNEKLINLWQSIV